MGLMQCVAVITVMGFVGLVYYYTRYRRANPQHPFVKFAFHVWELEVSRGEPRHFSLWFMDALGFNIRGVSRHDSIYRIAQIENEVEAIAWFDSWFEHKSPPIPNSIHLRLTTDDGEALHVQYILDIPKCIIHSREGRNSNIYSADIQWDSWVRDHDMEYRIYGKTVGGCVVQAQ